MLIYLLTKTKSLRCVYMWVWLCSCLGRKQKYVLPVSVMLLYPEGLLIRAGERPCIWSFSAFTVNSWHLILSFVGVLLVVNALSKSLKKQKKYTNLFIFDFKMPFIITVARNVEQPTSCGKWSQSSFFGARLGGGHNCWVNCTKLPR